MKRKLSRRALTRLLLAASVIFLVSRLRQRNRYPYLGLLRKAMKARYGADAAAAIVEEVLARYCQHYQDRKHYKNRTLQMQLEKNILPTLALYQVLKEINPDQQALLVEMEEFLEMPFVVPMKVIPLMRFFPDPFAVFRPAFHLIMKAFPQEGWDNEWEENSDRAIVFNTRGCFIKDVVTEYGAPELARVFCHTDDLIGSALPESIRYVRQGTLARGDECCDFRFERAG